MPSGLPLCILLFHCFAHLGSWARNVGLLKQTACQWYLLQQQCQEMITLWPICKHYIAHDTRTFIPYKYQSSFLNSTTLIISYYLVRNSSRRNLSSVENSSLSPSVPWDKDMQRHHVQYRTIRWKSTRQNSLRHKTSTDSKPANE